MITCQKAGCGQAATHALQIGCGTYTDPEESLPRAKILMGVLVCAECLDDETAERWLELNPDLGRLLVLAMGGGPPPDLTRAVVLGVPIDGPEYQHWQLTQLDLRN